MMNNKIAAVRYVVGEPEQTFETLAGEAPLQIKINGNPYTITMRTPGHDKMLATGLLFTERIIRHQQDILHISETPDETSGHTVTIDVLVKEEIVTGKNLFNRSIASSASCGVCGKIELCDLITPEKPLHTSHRLNIHHIPGLLQQMQAEQATFEKTGGSHAAAAFDIDGKMLSVKEDIGRHNAVDKVIGGLVLMETLHQAAILFISGRVSYEIVAKCAEASIPFLLAVSAPSSLAVRFCRDTGITLVGFCRENRATVYANAQNILRHAPAKETSMLIDKAL
jgi:FdhD protein